LVKDDLLKPWEHKSGKKKDESLTLTLGGTSKQPLSSSTSNPPKVKKNHQFMQKNSSQELLEVREAIYMNFRM
jgi:hypothetical protein